MESSTQRNGIAVPYEPVQIQWGEKALNGMEGSFPQVTVALLFFN